MRDALKDTMEIPDDPELDADLTGPNMDSAQSSRFS